MTDQGNSKEKKRDKSSEKERKPYLKPLLKEYGHVEEITQTGGNTIIEGFTKTRRQ
jgi:hypothetical protein